MSQWSSAPSSQFRRDVGGLYATTRDRNDEIVGIVIRRIEFDAIEIVEDRWAEPAQPLVAVNERMISNDRLQQNSAFFIYGWIDLSRPKSGRGPMRSRIKQAEVAYRSDVEIGD